MKEIVVISGKGGCGKTSVTAGLAYLAANDIVLADADVDAADMHLLMAPDNTVEESFYSGKLAVVDQDKCTRCRICIEHCHFDAISIRDSKLEINKLDCEGCGLCTHVCPQDALHMETQRAGLLFEATSRLGTPLVHARLDIAADNSGKLVTEVKNRSREVAEQFKKDIILTDGPPGIGCPVIASLTGASLAVIVTEPTQSGWHDMKRMNDLLNKMQIPAVILLNKANLNPGLAADIKKFAADNNLGYTIELPYDPVFSKAISEGITVPEYGRDDLTDLFRQAWKIIIETLK
ncbi:MAG: ATP-binding protein [Bacteroidota bacterium]|nr:ATP-binding protein [Bacteroidota bacterium]